MKREISDYLKDIVESIEKAIKFVEGITYDEFVQDDKTIFALIRALEVIGEAVKNVPQELREKYADIPWKEMTGMRDKLIHQYFGVKFDVLWKTVKEEIPPIKPMFEKMLKDLEKQY